MTLLQAPSDPVIGSKNPYFPSDLPLPHWNWAGREGEITPIHVFTSGDEAELFLNGKSLGRKKKGEFEYRLRWDSVKYSPGIVKVIAYKKGKRWAEQTIQTTEKAAQLLISADRNNITADGSDLFFITVKVADRNGKIVSDATNKIIFSIEGLGEIVATDNGDPADLVAFPSKERAAYSGLALAIIRSEKKKPGTIKITAMADGLKKAIIEIRTR